MASSRTYSLIGVLTCSIFACAASFSTFVGRLDESLKRFSRQVSELCYLALSIALPRDFVARLDAPAEIKRRGTDLALVRNFSAHRRARFDRGHVDQGWLAAA